MLLVHGQRDTAFASTPPLGPAAECSILTLELSFGYSSQGVTNDDYLTGKVHG